MIAAVMVLYNPDQDDILENIQSCSAQVQHIFLVDNSENPNVGLASQLKDLQNASYIWNNGNQGIAHALNVGAKKAREANYQWLLTLDQDTRLPPQFVEQMRLQGQLLSAQQVGILAPSYSNTQTIAIDDQNSTDIKAKAVLFTMTSGNLLNLKSYQIVGGFMDQLFIDHVDHEYCLRLNANGYKVYETSAIVLKHKPGREIRVSVGRKTINYASHSPLRLYYFCRNGLKVSQLYNRQFPQFRRFFKNLLLKEVAKILLFEDEKIKRIRMITKGYRDFKKNRFGALTS